MPSRATPFFAFKPARLPTLLAAALLVACGGGGGDSSPPPSPPPPVTPPSVSDLERAATPRDVDAQAVSSTEVIVTWSDVTADETGFVVERRSSGGTWALVQTTAANSQRYADTGLANDTAYEYRVSVQQSGRTAVPSDARVARTDVATGTARLYYVDGCVDNTGSNSGTLANPWRSIQTAAFNLRAGQTVLVRNRTNCPSATVYRTTANATTGAHGFAVLQIGNDAGQDQFTDGGQRSGTANAWITYRNYPGERPLIRSTRSSTHPSTGAFANGNFHGISVRNASYIVVEGFEIVGHLDDVPLQEATDLNAFYAANPSAPITSVLDSSGITVGNGGQSAARPREIPHHVIVRNNIVRDHPGGGINALFADWVTIENNSVRNVSAYSPYGASAINVYRAKDVDADTSSYKIVIRGNTATGAQNLFPCRCVNYTKATDGNGVILDQLAVANTDVLSTPTGTPANPIPAGTYTLPAYTGRTLVVNNIVTRNGGRGIHVFQSTNADVAFNTTHENSLLAVTGDGEITSQQSSNVRVANNIMVARTDRPTHWINFANATRKASDAASVVFDRNLIFGGNPAAAQVQDSATNGVLAANNRVGADPRFATTTGALAFTLQTGSPAVDNAFTLDWARFTAPLLDRLRAPRPRGAAPDIGAIESF